MLSISRFVRLLPLMALVLLAWDAQAQSFRVQCPTHTALHPLVNAAGVSGRPDSTLPNPHIKCQQISGGDGFATMGDGTQTYLFAFGPLSGLSNMVKGLPGTVTAAEFNQNNLDSVTGIAAGRRSRSARRIARLHRSTAPSAWCPTSRPTTAPARQARC